MNVPVQTSLACLSTERFLVPAGKVLETMHMEDRSCYHAQDLGAISEVLRQLAGKSDEQLVETLACTMESKTGICLKLLEDHAINYETVYDTLETEQTRLRSCDPL